jgi:hypothetical protein
MTTRREKDSPYKIIKLSADDLKHLPPVRPDFSKPLERSVQMRLAAEGVARGPVAAR